MERRHAEDLKEAGRDELTGDLFRCAVAREHRAHVGERAHLFERGRALPPPEIVAGADHVVTARAAATISSQRTTSLSGSWKGNRSIAPR